MEKAFVTGFEKKAEASGATYMREGTTSALADVQSLFKPQEKKDETLFFNPDKIDFGVGKGVSNFTGVDPLTIQEGNFSPSGVSLYR